MSNSRVTPQLAELIKTGRASGKTWHQIAMEANRLGLRGQAGAEWTSGTMSHVGINNHIVGRVRNTVRGKVGSSGTGKVRANGKESRSNGSTSHMEKIEELLTSNLPEDLKLECVGLIAAKYVQHGQ